MALRKGVVVAICAIGLAKAAVPLDAPAQPIPSRALSAAEQARYLTAETPDAIGAAMSAIMIATACDDTKLASGAKRAADAALAAKGLRPAHDLLAEARALFETRPQLRKSLVGECPKALRKAEANLARHQK